MAFVAHYLNLVTHRRDGSMQVETMYADIEQTFSGNRARRVRVPAGEIGARRLAKALREDGVRKAYLAPVA